MGINTLTQTIERTHDVYVENPNREKTMAAHRLQLSLWEEKGYNTRLKGNDLELHAFANRRSQQKILFVSLYTLYNNNNNNNNNIMNTIP